MIDFDWENHPVLDEPDPPAHPATLRAGMLLVRGVAMLGYLVMIVFAAGLVAGILSRVLIAAFHIGWRVWG